MILMLSSAAARHRDLNHHFDRHQSPRNYVVIIICLRPTSPNSPRGSGATVGVHYPRYPTHWFKYSWVSPFRLPGHAYLAHHSDLAPEHNAIRLPLDSAREPRAPSKDKTYKYHSFINYYVHPYPWTDNTFNQVTRSPCQAGVMRAYNP
jgi:hypothetical protein